MSERLEFGGQVVIVTGAGGGMGKAHALELARRGARVVVNDLGGSPLGGGADESLAAAVVEEIRQFGGEAIANTESVATAEGGASLVDDAVREWGRVDAVVANAAIARTTPFPDVTADELDSLLDVNLRGVFFVAQPAFRAMRDHGGGRIVVINSIAGLLGARDQTTYASSKAALTGLIRVIAIEGADRGIVANGVCPSAYGTRMAKAIIAERAAQSSTAAAAVQALSPEVYSRRAPELITPLVVRLAHESCPANGDLFWAWAGGFGRAATSLNLGWHATSPTPEDVVAHWDEIVNADTLREIAPNAHEFMAGEIKRLIPTGEK